MFKHSIIYRLLSSSWLLGWMVSGLQEDKRDYYSGSYVGRFSNRIIEAVLQVLYRSGDAVRKAIKGSIVFGNFPGVLGILILGYFVFDLTINNYGILRTLIEIALALSGLFLLLLNYIPGLWQGSLLGAFFHWWGKTD